MSIELPILFVDVETTGLDAAVDELLEIAAILTDTDGSEIDRYESVISASCPVDALRYSATPVVRKMHDANGLWDALNLDGWPELEEVDDELAALVRTHLSEEQKIKIAGNSPRLDLNFIDTHMPALAKLLHYRFFDVTGIETFLTMHTDYNPPKRGAFEHRAMADVESCLQQWKHAREWLTKSKTEIASIAWNEGANAMRAAWDTGGEIIEPECPYTSHWRENNQ